jgi:hypothetical protein
MGTATAVIGSWVGLSVIFALLVGRAMAVARRADPPEMPEFAPSLAPHPAFARRERPRLRA